MKREHRYLVTKYKDVLAYLTEVEQMQLLALFKTIHIGREEAGKRNLECVCVEDDWPEYEIVWAMIMARVDGKPLEIPAAAERRKVWENGTFEDCLKSEVADLRAALATPPAQSSGQSLEAAIMALPIKVPLGARDMSSGQWYLNGHLDARRAAAKLASQPPAPQATCPRGCTGPDEGGSGCAAVTGDCSMDIVAPQASQDAVAELGAVMDSRRVWKLSMDAGFGTSWPSVAERVAFAKLILADGALAATMPSHPTVPEGCVLMPIEPDHAIIRAMSASQARDDEGEFTTLGDLIDFSGDNKTHTCLRAAYAAAIAAAPSPLLGDAT